MTKPTEVKQISFDFIIDFIKERGKEKDIAWLKELANKEVVDRRTGAMRNISFVEVRNEFAKKYMPEIVPPPKATKPTMKQRLAEL